MDDCLMTEDCPGFDYDRRVCLLRPGDCELAAGTGDADRGVDAPARRSGPRLDAAPAFPAGAAVPDGRRARR
jgi:hypothetical protein